ncbi:MAG: chemotaxis protein CheW, partial [Halanaerobium sp.]
MKQKEDKIVDFTKKRKKKNINEIQYLTFKIGSEYYGIKLIENKEVIEPPAITKVPNTKKYVMGVINLRGQIVPVINLKSKLNLSYENNKGKKIIIVTDDNNLVGIMVDTVEDVVGIDKNNIEDIKE